MPSKAETFLPPKGENAMDFKVSGGTGGSKFL